MRGIRICLIAAIALGVAGVAGAAGPMVLTSGGDLYSAGTRDNQIVITARYADGTISDLFVPQSAARSKALCRWESMKRPEQFTSCGRSGPEWMPESVWPDIWTAPGSDPGPSRAATGPPLPTL